MTTSERFWPTPDGVNRKSRTALHGAGPRMGRGENYLHSSPPGLEQAVELSEGILPKEYDDESQLTPSAQRFWPTPRNSPQENRTTKPTPSQLAGKHGRYLGSEVMEEERRLFPTSDASGHKARLRGNTQQSNSLEALARTSRLTSSPAASPVSPGVPPANSAASPMTAISGRNCIDLWFPSGPVGAFLKMCLGSSVWKVALTGYSLRWKRAATPQGRSLYRLRLSAPTTAATGSGLWPTTTASAATGGQNPDSGGQAGLSTSVLHSLGMWPTPRTEGFDAGSPCGNPDSLHSAVKMLHTPTSKANQLSPPMVERDAGSYGHGMLPTAAASDWKGSSQEGQRRGQLSEVVAGMKLSARWVGALMGYPEGWLDLDPSDSDPIGKPASPASRRTRPTA
jgi:hypothetical protein